MAHLTRISEAASMALHAMVLLAAKNGPPASTKELAGLMHGSEAHLSKVLQRLARAGLAVSGRGPKGGFTLARPAREISLLSVFEAIEGPLEETRCLLDKPLCNGRCILGGLLSEVDRRASQYLSEKTLADFAGVFQGAIHERS